MKTSEDWCKEKGLKLGEDILDPDGWDRSNFEESWSEEITEQEFDRRVMFSTCMLNRDKKYFKEMLGQ